MSFEQTLEEIVRRVVREELASASNGADLELLTADDVAKLFKFTDRHSIYRLRREGALRSVDLGDNTVRFSRSVVSRFIQEHSSEIER